ncbi:hypothetical protein Acr_29g0002600 [Actinidia rufa]|uniref:Retrotransposon gag domain-containing protein n=1 Tax=Actinidia rufa TaxID=165716 RepID=A0A7J0HDF8_9ERIC|nr:hypothetical protein Acr_29g0002600 [Actinidia rufa]
MASSYFISDIRGISFYTYLSEDLPNLLNDSPFSIYKKGRSPIIESLYSPWSDSHAGGVLSGLTPASNVCPSAQVAKPLPRKSIDLSVSISLETMSLKVTTVRVEYSHQGIEDAVIELKLQPKQRGKSTTQKIQNLDARIDAINTSTTAPITVDALIQQTEPLFPEKVIRTRVLSKFKLSTQLKGVQRKNGSNRPPRLVQKIDDTSGILERGDVQGFLCYLEGTNEKNIYHLFTVHQKDGESLKDYVKHFKQVVLEMEDASDKVVIMAMMEGLYLGPLFNSLSKNVLETQPALQSKADKYIVAKELVKAKRIRRGRDDHKRKEPDIMQSDYRADVKSNRYDDNRPIVGNIQVIHGGFGSGGCSSSRKRHAKEANRWAKVEPRNQYFDDGENQNQEETSEYRGEIEYPAILVENVAIVKQFLKLKPATFSGEMDPVKANEWLLEMEKNFRLLMCGEQQKSGDRLIPVDWEKYVPRALQNAKCAEFEHLKQTGKTITDYEAAFTNLAEYAPHLVAIDEMRARRFEDGLRYEIKRVIRPLVLPTYADVLDRAIIVEQDKIEKMNGSHQKKLFEAGNWAIVPRENQGGGNARPRGNRQGNQGNQSGNGNNQR